MAAWPGLWLTCSTQGGHISSSRKPGQSLHAALVAQRKLCFANTEPLGSSSQILCKHQDIPGLAGREGMPACVSLSCQGSSCAHSRRGGLAEATLLMSCPVFPAAPQWQQSLEMNIGITIPCYSDCCFTNISPPKPLTNSMSWLLLLSSFSRMRTSGP